MIDIGQYQGQHQQKEPAVADQQDVFILMRVGACQVFDKRDKPVLNVQKALTAIGFAGVLSAQHPVFEILAVISPAFLIRFLFEDPAIVFPQRFRYLVGDAKKSRKGDLPFAGLEEPGWKKWR